MNESNMKVKTELSGWIDDEDRIVTRRVVDRFGTEVVVLRDPEGERYRVLRGFVLGEGAGVSVDVNDAPLENAIEYLLEHYSL